MAVPSLLGATIAVSAIAATSVAANAAETATVSVSSVEATEPVVEAAVTPVEAVTLPVEATKIADATIANSASAPAKPATTTASPSQAIVSAADDLTATGIVGQVTSVSQLSDVQPTDWAFQALQSLVERYGCIVGYPDRTYRGNRALTRYEFAAGLNACMDRINELIAAG
ncbi:MAG TPA: iron uptake porin, partial [Candidatus Sericytochromatia bacterium]